MATGDRREPITLRWHDGYNRQGEPDGTETVLHTWGALVKPETVGVQVGELNTALRIGSARVRIAAGGTVTPSARLAGLTCELRGVVRVVEQVSDPDGRARWYDLHLAE